MRGEVILIDKKEAQCGKSIVNNCGRGGWEGPSRPDTVLKEEYYIRYSSKCSINGHEECRGFYTSSRVKYEYLTIQRYTRYFVTWRLNRCLT